MDNTNPNAAPAESSKVASVLRSYIQRVPCEHASRTLRSKDSLTTLLPKPFISVNSSCGNAGDWILSALCKSNTIVSAKNAAEIYLRLAEHSSTQQMIYEGYVHLGGGSDTSLAASLQQPQSRITLSRHH